MPLLRIIETELRKNVADGQNGSVANAALADELREEIDAAERSFEATILTAIPCWQQPTRWQRSVRRRRPRPGCTAEAARRFGVDHEGHDRRGRNARRVVRGRVVGLRELGLGEAPHNVFDGLLHTLARHIRRRIGLTSRRFG